VNLAIIDLGCGNIGSLRVAFQRLGVEPCVTARAEEIASADRLILPGVGAAGFAMERMDALGLRDTIGSLQQPALGICLGMQLLFERSDEEDASCLGLLRGRVRALEPAPGRPVPHMGWTKVRVLEPELGIADGDYLYFAHSFACDPGPEAVATASYGREFAAVIRQRNWLGAQFHPERSGDAGRSFLERFLA
jgi:glutamine amidotransferase